MLRKYFSIRVVVSYVFFVFSYFKTGSGKKKRLTKDTG